MGSTTSEPSAFVGRPAVTACQRRLRVEPVARAPDAAAGGRHPHAAAGAGAAVGVDGQGGDAPGGDRVAQALGGRPRSKADGRAQELPRIADAAAVAGLLRRGAGLEVADAELLREVDEGAARAADVLGRDEPARQRPVLEGLLVGVLAGLAALVGIADLDLGLVPAGSRSRSPAAWSTLGAGGAVRGRAAAPCHDDERWTRAGPVPPLTSYACGPLLKDDRARSVLLLQIDGQGEVRARARRLRVRPCAADCPASRRQRQRPEHRGPASLGPGGHDREAPAAVEPGARESGHEVARRSLRWHG